MFEEEFRGRLDAGFNPLDYSFAGYNDYSISFEYRHPDKPLRFAVKYGEGGVVLLWTEEAEMNLLLDRGFPQGVNGRPFSGSPEEFWQAVSDIIDGREPA